MIKCTVCGETLEEKELPKLEVAKDEATGIELVYDGEKYEDTVEICVEEAFDGAAYNLVNAATGATEQKVYDVTMLINGSESQPNGKIKVKIPLPAGFDPAHTFVYHVNTETGKVERMAATYENGYMVFETDHFSYYALVDTSSVPTVLPAITIKNYVATKNADYKATITFTAVTENVPNGATVQWFVNDKKAEPGATCTVKQATADYTVQCKLIGANGAVLAESEVETVKVNTGFFAKLIAFFKGLFGSLPVIAQRLRFDDV